MSRSLRRRLLAHLPLSWERALRRLLGRVPPTLAQNSLALQERLRHSFNTAGGELHALVCLRSVTSYLARLGEAPRGHVLEIGSYPHPGLALALLLTGADRVTLNNVVPVENRLPRAYAENLASLLGVLAFAPRPLVDFVRPLPGVPEMVEVTPECLGIEAPLSAERLALPDNSLDLAFSITVLEHVRQPAALLTNLHRMLKPGAISQHDIDLRDHAHLYDAPLDFLRHSAEEFARLDPDSSRFRVSDYLREFRAAGFTVPYVGHCLPHAAVAGLTDNYGMVQVSLETTFHPRVEDVPTWVTEEQRRALAPEFQRYSLQELSVTGLQLTAVKPPGN